MQGSSSFRFRVSLSFFICAGTALWAAAPTGCLYKEDPAYCADRPNNYCACRTDAECTAPTSVCEVEVTNTCVECTADNAAACTGARPICGADHACHACTTHTDCASAACLEDGACAAEASVAYVAPAGTDNDQCTQVTPCTKVAKALATLRPYLKLSGTTSESLTLSGGRQVTFLADPGAKLRSSGGTSPVITVQGNGTSLTVVDLTISDAPNDPSGYGVLVPAGTGTPSLSFIRATISNNPAGGISTSGGTLMLARSVIRGNVGGGVMLANATFDITNNFFFNNGAQDSLVGALSILTTRNDVNRLELNSFNRNQTMDTIGPAIQCVAGAFTARNNIMSGNGTFTQLTQYGGSCQHAYSIATPGTLPAGTGNFSSDPAFLNTTTGDLHVSPMSPVRGLASPASSLTGLTSVDIDGQLRASPADLGADEIP